MTNTTPTAKILVPTATDPTRSTAVEPGPDQTDPTAGVAAGTAWNMAKDPTRSDQIHRDA